jgi:SAM-dependent methyltransferase
VVVDPIKRAINGAYAFCDEQEAALEQGLITEAQWFANHKRYFTELYLGSDNPRGQSGHGGDAARYRYSQQMILEAMPRDGTFIDIGCANGHLVEMLAAWSLEKGLRIDFYGLDISEKLLDLARTRIFRWRDRFYLGNALSWTPPRKFTYVCVKELDYVPRVRRKEFFLHLLEAYVEPRGRLILGPGTERRDEAGVSQDTSAWGYPPTGTVTKPHQEQPTLIRRLHWYDVPS